MQLLLLAAAQIFSLASSSRLWIEGQSSAHPWSCEAPVSDAQIEVDAAAPQMVRALNLRVDVDRIDCGKGAMNDKLRDALHADKFPRIEYRLTEAERLSKPGVKLEVTGDLTVNGKTRRATLQADVKPLPDGTAQAVGNIVMSMSDFDVEPPTAMLGLLKTANEINVKFDIRTAPRAAARATVR